MAPSTPGLGERDRRLAIRIDRPGPGPIRRTDDSPLVSRLMPRRFDTPWTRHDDLPTDPSLLLAKVAVDRREAVIELIRVAIAEATHSPRRCCPYIARPQQLRRGADNGRVHDPPPGKGYRSGAGSSRRRCGRRSRLPGSRPRRRRRWRSGGHRWPPSSAETRDRSIIGRYLAPPPKETSPTAGVRKWSRQARSRAFRTGRPCLLGDPSSDGRMVGAALRLAMTPRLKALFEGGLRPSAPAPLQAVRSWNS